MSLSTCMLHIWWFLITARFLMPSLVSGFRLYMPRNKLMNFLVTNGASAEERLYMDRCEHSSHDGKCYRALDGEPIKEWTQCTGSYSYSKSERKPQWTGFLESPAYITRIVLHTVDMPHSEMKTGFTRFDLLVDGLPCYIYNSTKFFEVRSFPCDAFGESVQVQSHVDQAYLALCEVEVYGVPVAFEALERPAWEVPVGVCDQSSAELGNKNCNNAIDNVFLQKEEAGKKLCFRSAMENEPYLISYLSVPALVVNVKLFLDLAHVAEMDKLEVLVNQRPCELDTVEDLKDSAGKVLRPGYKRADQPIYNCASKFGSNVQVINKKASTHLSLCQVQVFGYKLIIGSESEDKLLGCFKDKEDDPDLEMLVSTTMMSPMKCHKLCKRRNKGKFGLQNGQMCFCGMQHGKHGSSDACNMACKADKKYKCGGRNSNLIYEIIS